LGLRLRGCVAGCTPGSRRTGLRWARSTEADGERGCAGSPLHKFCTASLDIGPLIDGFVFCPTSGRYWRKSLSDIALLLSSLASFFAFLVLHSRVLSRLWSGFAPLAELPSVIVPTLGASKYFGKSIPFAAAT